MHCYESKRIIDNPLILHRIFFLFLQYFFSLSLSVILLVCYKNANDEHSGFGFLIARNLGQNYNVVVRWLYAFFLFLFVAFYVCNGTRFSTKTYIVQTLVTVKSSSRMALYFVVVVVVVVIFESCFFLLFNCRSSFAAHILSFAYILQLLTANTKSLCFFFLF